MAVVFVYLYIYVILLYPLVYIGIFYRWNIILDVYIEIKFLFGNEIRPVKMHVSRLEVGHFSFKMSLKFKFAFPEVNRPKNTKLIQLHFKKKNKI